MSKRTFILTLLFVALLIGGIVWRVFYSGAPVQTPAEEEPTGTSNLFPFGKRSTTTPNSQTTATGETGGPIDISNIYADASKFRQIWAEPVAGATFTSTTSGAATIRFVDRGTGHIYESAIDAATPTQISNVTIPQIIEALWGKGGTSLIMRYLKDGAIQSFSARISTSSVSDAIDGVFLPANIGSIAVRKDKILYLDPANNGSIVMANFDGTKRSEVVGTAFGDWALSWGNDKKAFVYPKPSGLVSAPGFILDIEKGTLSKTGSDVAGLEGSMSPSSDYVFMSYASLSSGVTAASYSISKKAYVDLAPGTIASKCAWSQVDPMIIYCAEPRTVSPGTYPDDWYKGTASFSDRVWKIRVDTGESELVFDPIAYGTDVDASNIIIGPNDSSLLLTNKKDLSLWLYKI